MAYYFLDRFESKNYKKYELKIVQQQIGFIQ